MRLPEHLLELAGVTIPAWIPVSKISMPKIKAGDILILSDRGHDVPVKFLGFSDDSKKYGDSGSKFKTLKDVYKNYGVKNLKSLEGVFADRDYGYGVYALFEYAKGDPDAGSQFSAYIYAGRWAIGSGADRFQLNTAKKND